MRITTYKNSFFPDRNKRKYTCSGHILINSNKNSEHETEHRTERAA